MLTGTAPEGPVVRRAGNALLVGFRVSPAASRTAVKGLYGDRVKVAVRAPAESGRANAELVDALARWTGVMRDNVYIKSGLSSRDKVVAFEGVDELELRNRLATLLRGERAEKKD